MHEASRMTDASTLKSIIIMEECRLYSELYHRIESGCSIQPQEMAIIKNPHRKRLLLDLLIERQIARICDGSYQA